MARKLDQTDQQILTLLAENARQSVKELARRIGLSRSAAQERLARLERDGVLAGYTIRRNDPAANGVAAYFIIKTRQAMCDDLAPHHAQDPGGGGVRFGRRRDRRAWWRWWPTA